MRKLGVALLLCGLLLGAGGGSQPSEWKAARNSRTFGGFSKVSVLVEDLPQTLDGTGVHQESIRQLIELECRKTGLQVDSQGQVLPYIYCQVNAKSHKAGLVAISVTLSLNDEVIIVRNNGTTWTAIWERSTIGIGGADYVKEGVESALNELLREFLNNYLAANPRTAPVAP